ncbi:DUF2523 family protein [Dyella jiangningensis]|uniref:DUF2523 domain-containing protein n=1 Tax=Dyella jiangningensis TaxID=1379159 RepID=A0A328P7C1_9GAMM|nr:DUF2523 family protein [Dyella jiangningensis]RAO78187.1 hypothetical protein CA260_10300 [Dyella jiangningensis]
MFDGLKAWLWTHLKMLTGIFISTMLLKSGGIIGKIFGTLGLAFVTYKYVMPEVKGLLLQYASGLSTEVYNLITYTKFDVFMCLIISAVATKLASNLMVGKVGT